MSELKVIEELQRLNGLAPPSAPVALVASATLPAAGAYSAVATAIPVPAGKTCALLLIAYTHGAGGSVAAGEVTARVYGGSTADASTMRLLLTGNNTATATVGQVAEPGGAMPVTIPPGINLLSIDLKESGDTAHIGTAAVSVIFS